MTTTNFSNDQGTATSGPDESSGVKDQAQQAAGTASDEGQRVAGVAQDEIKNVTAEAQNQFLGLMDEATSQVEEQSKEQKTRLAETVRTFGDDLQGMTSQSDNGGMAAQLVQQVADQARGLASRLESREPSELLDDVRRFARKRPGTFLLGALAAGIVVGRVARGAKSAQGNPSAGDAGDAGAAVTVGTTTQQPVAVSDGLHATPGGQGLASSPAETDLGPTGVEISEAGVGSLNGGSA